MSSMRLLLASTTKARPNADSLIPGPSMEGWKGIWARAGSRGEMPFQTGGYLSTQQLFQDLRIGQLLAGRDVQSVVQDLDGLLESQGLQVLTGLFQGDGRHLAPPTSQGGRFVHVQGAPLHVTHRYLYRHRSPRGPVVSPRQALPLAGQGEALTRPLGQGMDRDALISGPDFHRPPSLSHLNRLPHPFPVDAVAGALPADEAVPGHLPVLSEVGRQSGALRLFAQMRPLLGQHLPGDPVGRPVHPGVGHRVAPLQGLLVQVGIIGEAQAGPHVCESPRSMDR